MENLLQTTRVQRVLYTLYLLTKGDISIEKLIEELSKASPKEADRTSVNSYINTLIKNNFDIEVKKENNTKIYHLNQKAFKLNFKEDEIWLIEKIKKIIISQKNVNKIKKAMEFLYKFILLMSNCDDDKNILIDFEYYSKINWYLVDKLEKHCKNKDVIIIDYAKHGCELTKMKIHCNSISIGEWSDKIYLWGELFDNGELSFLPADKIFMIDKVVEENVPFNIKQDDIEYKISRALYDEIDLDEEEKLVKLTEDFAIIKRNKNNKFYIVQRLMSFCPDLHYISDEEIKKEVEKRLKLLKKEYEKQ